VKKGIVCQRNIELMDANLFRVVDTFFSKFTKLTYKKADIIIRAGDAPPGVLYLKSGLVRMSFVAPSGDMLVLHVFKPGSHFPMTWVINNTPNRYYFEALTPVEVIRAPKEEVRKFLKTHPQVSEHFLARIMTGLSGVMSRMEHLVFESAYHKTIKLLLYYVNNFGEKGSEARLSIPLTHKEIAAWIGTTRETASLQIEVLKKKKLIMYKHRYIIVPDIARLEQEIAD
jgi:CRP/FNR family transcriptional regulator, global nitrogen regulator